MSHLCKHVPLYTGLPRWLSGQESTCQCRSRRRHRFNPWVRKIPWKRGWQSTPVFLPGESCGQRGLLLKQGRGDMGAEREWVSGAGRAPQNPRTWERTWLPGAEKARLRTAERKCPPREALLPSTEHPSWFARPRDHFLHSLQSLRDKKTLPRLKIMFCPCSLLGVL